MADERNYVVEMRNLINKCISTDRQSAPDLARELVDRLRDSDPDLLYGYFRQHAVVLIATLIRDQDRQARERAREQSGPRAIFAQAAQKHDAGDSAPIKSLLTKELNNSRLLDARYPVEDGSRLPLGDLYAPQCYFVAQGFRDRSRANAFEHAFFKALAVKVGDGTVRERFTEAELVRLRDSISF